LDGLFSWWPGRFIYRKKKNLFSRPGGGTVSKNRAGWGETFGCFPGPGGEGGGGRATGSFGIKKRQKGSGKGALIFCDGGRDWEQKNGGRGRGKAPVNTLFFCVPVLWGRTMPVQVPTGKKNGAFAEAPPRFEKSPRRGEKGNFFGEIKFHLQNRFIIFGPHEAAGTTLTIGPLRWAPPTDTSQKQILCGFRSIRPDSGRGNGRCCFLTRGFTDNFKKKKKKKHLPYMHPVLKRDWRKEKNRGPGKKKISGF